MGLRLTLITAIWGRPFVDLFQHICIRSLLAPGNLRELSVAHDVRYVIQTTKEDAAHLQATDMFRRLSAIVNVEFSLFSPDQIDIKQTISHALLWRRGVNQAQRRGEIVFLIIPDVIYARGTLMRWAARFVDGMKAIYTPGPLVVLETVLLEVDRRFPDREREIDLAPEEAMDIVCRHLHPITISMLRDSPRRTLHPEEDSRPVTGVGFVMRFHTSQPFCFDPSHFRLHDTLNPENRLEDVAFEPCTAVSVEPLLKHWDMYYRAWRLDADRISNIGSWRVVFATPGNRHEARFPYRFMLPGAAERPDLIRRAEGEGAFLLQQFNAAATIYRVHQLLMNLGCHTAAEVLAVAHYEGRLRRHLAVRGNLRLLIPEDRAFDGAAGQFLARLMNEGKVRELVELVLAHIIVEEAPKCRAGMASGENPMPIGSPVAGFGTAKGGPAEEALLRQALIVRGPFPVDNCEIFIIDRLLVDLPKGAQVKEPSIEPDLVVPHSLPAPAKRRRIVGAIRAAPRAALSAFGAPIQRLATRSAFAKRMYRSLQGSPRIARHLRRLERFHQIAMQHGFANALRIAGPHIRALIIRLPVIGPVFAVCVGIVRELGRLSPRRIHERIMVADAWRTQGALAQKLLATRGPGRKRVKAGRLLAQIRSARALISARELLEFYQSRVLGQAARSAPLDQVTNFMTSTEVSTGGIEAALQHLVVDDRSFGEAWLELGYLYFDCGKKDAALQCFRQCATARERLEPPRGYGSLRARAFREIAVLADELGFADEARLAYERSLALAPDQSILRIQYARHLRRIGRIREGNVQLAAAMEYDAPRWPLPVPPRALTDLDLSHLRAAVQ